MNLSFKQFLCKLDEDLQQDIDKLMADISMVDTQISQRTQPLLARKNQMMKMLAIKQRQKQVEDKRNAQSGSDASQTQGQPGAQSNQMVTPGSSGSSTPGSAVAR